ncbi:hypothetical protein AVEN_267325-1 [Araneus ventricosus]|uniref:Uncharacterized protein n=1 Tax=Araneus ventricosus TaxID=182803 RepID=A0A4Y2DM78_ARAVE|nr:hypothetical protein AVEN_267325-1 [Araneus ventricosus]
MGPASHTINAISHRETRVLLIYAAGSLFAKPPKVGIAFLHRATRHQTRPIVSGYEKRGEKKTRRVLDSSPSEDESTDYDCRFDIIFHRRKCFPHAAMYNRGLWRISQVCLSRWPSRHYFAI